MFVYLTLDDYKVKAVFIVVLDRKQDNTNFEATCLNQFNLATKITYLFYCTLNHGVCWIQTSEPLVQVKILDEDDALDRLATRAQFF